MNNALPQGLPHKLLIVPSSNIYMKTAEAIRLIGIRRAREVFSDSGELVGIELGHFGPVPGTSYLSLPPAELPNTIFQPPANGRTQYRTCRAIVRMTRNFWRSSHAGQRMTA